MKLIKNKKIIFIISILIILSLLVIFVIKNFNSNKVEKDYISNIDMTDLRNAKMKNGEKYNISKNITKEHKYKDKYLISDMKIYTNGGMCYLEFKLKNLNDDECNKSECQLILNFYSKNQEILLNFINFDIPELKKGESKNIKLEHPLDFTISYDYEIIM